MKKILVYIFLLVCLTSCANKTPQVVVNASFLTNKDSYSLQECVKVTNTTTVENSVIAICKWEWAGKVSYETEPSGISFDEEGDYTITLTVTSNDGHVKGSCEKKIKVEDNNIRPVADFTWNPETVKAGEPVTFTDKSYDPDGRIVAWHWTLGSSLSKEQNPTHTFVEYGNVDVTLTVTDNAEGTSSKTVTIPVEKGKYDISIKWQYTYGEVSGASTRFASPALNQDGTHVYAISDECKLFCLDPDSGSKIWSYDYSKNAKGTVEYNGKDGSALPVACPSVDDDGIIYIAAGYDETNTSGTTDRNGLYAINPDGTLKWWGDDGTQVHYGFHSPLIIGDWVCTNQRFGARDETGATNKELLSQDQGVVMVNRSTGVRTTTMYTSQGSWGGMAGWGDNIYALVAGNTTHLGGIQIGFGDGKGTWTLVNGSSGYSLESLWPAYGYRGLGCQMAISKDHCLYVTVGETVNSATSNGLIICYNLDELTSTRSSAPVPVWKTQLKSLLCAATASGSEPKNLYGNGAAVSENGMVFVTTNTTIYGLKSDGTIVWQIEDSGTLQCVPAVDKDGFVYYASSTGYVTKVLGTSGEKVASVNTGSHIYSSPTIGPDGSIYVIGSNGSGLATIYCLETNDRKGPADNWSQLSGNYCKTAYMAK